MNIRSDNCQSDPGPDVIVTDRRPDEQKLLEWAEKFDRYYETVWLALLRKYGPVQAINAMKNWCEKLSDDKYKRWVKLLTRLSLAERQGKDNNSAPTSRANDSR